VEFTVAEYRLNPSFFGEAFSAKGFSHGDFRGFLYEATGVHGLGFLFLKGACFMLVLALEG